MKSSITEYAAEIGAIPPQPAPFNWSIINGAETWTDDASTIAAMSDPPIIDGLIREAEVVQIVGAAKTNKTWLTLNLSLCVAGGQHFLGRTTHARKVLYLDYELKPGTFCKRMSMLATERPENFHYQCLRGSDRLPSINEIAEMVKREGFGMVVVDSLYRTGWLAEENSNDSTPRDLAPLQRFADETRAAVVCVDHTGKGGGSEKSAVDSSRGASSKGGFFDSILVLRATDKGADPEGTYAALDSALRDWPGVDGMPLISFSWTPTSASIEVEGSVPRESADSNAARVLESLASAENSVDKKWVAGATGLTPSTARRVLDELAIKRKVVVSADPSHSQRLLYRLPDAADPTAPNPAKP